MLLTVSLSNAAKAVKKFLFLIRLKNFNSIRNNLRNMSYRISYKTTLKVNNLSKLS